MKTLALNSLTAACSVALAIPLTAPAAQSVLEEIVVTAQKRQESIQEIPISIKALSAETLETVNAASLDDITRLVPSMSMTNLSRGGNNVQIRGLGSNVGSVGTVAIYNDGVIAASRVGSSGTFAEQDSALFDVERVEVLRGPQGTLYGEGSFGGVINIISKRPDPQGFDAGFSGSWFAIDDGGSGSSDLNGMINVPVGDKLALRLVGFRNDHDGYIDGYDILPTLLAADPAGTPPTLVGKDLNTEKVTGGRFSIGYTGEAVNATLILKRQETAIGLMSLETDSSDVMRNYSPQGNENNSVFFGPTPLAGGSDNTTDEGILEINVETSRGTLTSITGYGQVDVAAAGGTTSDTEAYSEELRFSTSSDGILNWTAGAFYRTVEKTMDFSGTPLRGDEIDQWSIFGQVYWDITPALRATFGLRYGEQDSVADDLLNEAVLGPLARAEAKFDDLSPKIALDWRMNDDTLLYASIANGFRAGGANIDTSLGLDPNYSRDFQSDSIVNYEIGAKATFWEKKLTINTAIFYVDWSDIQIDRPIQDNTDPNNPEGIDFIVKNGQDAHSYGVEADLYFNPGGGWEVVLGGSLANPRYDSGTIDSDYGTFDLKGMHLPSAPDYLFNASVSRRFPLGSSGMDGLIRADYSMRGNSFADVPNTAPGTDFDSGRTDLVNLRAGVLAGKWEVQAFVTNLTNTDASSFDFDLPGVLLYRAKLQPRTVGVNVKLNFH